DLQDLELALEREMDARQQSEDRLQQSRQEEEERRSVLDERISELLARQEELKEERALLQKKVDEDHRAAEELQHQLEAVKQALAEAEKSLEASESKRHEKQAELEEQQKENERLLAGLRQMEKEGEQALNDAKYELKSVQEALSRVREEGTEELTKLRDSHTAALKALEEAQRERQEIQQRMEAMQAKSEEGEEELAQLRTALDRAEREAASYRAEAEQLRRTLADVEGRLRESDEEQQQHVSMLQQEIAELQSTVTGQQEQLRRSESERAELEERFMQDGEPNAGALEVLKHELEEARAQLSARMESELTVAEEREAMQQRLKTLTEDRDDAVQQVGLLKDEVRHLKDGIETVQSDLAALQEAADSWKQKADEEAERGHLLEDNIERLEVQLRAAQNRSQYERFVPPPEGADSPRRGRGSILGLSLAALMGALGAFAGIDAHLTAQGEGELVQRFLREWSAVQQDDKADPLLKEDEGGGVRPQSPAKQKRSAVKEVRPTAAKELEKRNTEAQPKTSKMHVPQQRDRLVDGGMGPVMVRIPGGVFAMGGKGALAADSERPVHNVRVGPFHLSRNEVTFDDYDQFVLAIGREAPDDEGWGRGSRPVVNVSWEDAVAYTEWLSEQSGHQYRLPSEAQWEYAASGGSQSRFWWGDNAGRARAVCDGCGSRWDGASTAPVGSFEANPFGLHDVAGNVMEWTADCFNPGYEGAPADGSPWLQGDCQQRVVRGGAFSTPPERMRSSGRQAFSAGSGFRMIGFRVVRLD
ncbi:MAG TPA: hypothetical protein EYH03_00600, partial [Chromatiales bacterium]|nr:hypothetical protein [Chromatiales bacterium]